MLQKYTFFVLFLSVLNSISCTSPENEKQMAENKKLAVGSRAPLFSLPDQDGKLFNLSDHIGKNNLVLFFYPKDESYGCTKEACSFRDNYEVFKEAGAEVIGISSDDAASHRSFAAHHRLPFILLSDKDRKVASLYNVGKSMGLFSGRVTFIIDKQGIIRMIFSSQVNFEKHIDESLKMLKTFQTHPDRTGQSHI
jgi:thioredoxin-dependent peroxiredoxin